MTRLKRAGAVGGLKSRLRAGRLIQNALALMVSSSGTGLLGIVFWGVATHLASAATVGRASAEIAAMMLLSTLSQLSFGPIFERFLPIAGSRSRPFITRAYGACCLVAFAIAIGYIALGFAHNFLPDSFGWRALFVVSVVMWTIFVLQDAVLIGLRASKWVPVENILFALVKLAALPLFVALSASQGIFLAWTLPVAGTIFGVSRYLFKTAIPAQQALGATSTELPSMKEIVLLATAQYATLIFNVLSTSLVALIVIQRLGAVANAHYYLPAIIASGPTMLLWGLVTSFLVEGSAEPHLLRHHANVTLRAAIIVLLPSLLIGEVFAPQVLGVFGATYAENGTTLLRMLMLSIPATAVTAFYASFAWLDKRVWWLTVREFASSVVFFTVLFSFIGRYHLLAVGIASLVSSGLQGIFFLPISIRRYRRTTNSPVDESDGGSTASAAPQH